MHEWPRITTACADCGVGTITLGEWYMVKDELWERAWIGRRKSWHHQLLDGVVDVVPGTEILCIGCLEHRLGRTLVACDFTDAPVNDPDKPTISDRLRDRLITNRLVFNKPDGVFAFLVERVLQSVPEHDRARLRGSWDAMAHDNDDGPQAA
jgi:hypothetical protein